MLFEGVFVLICAFFQIQFCADQRRMVGIAQRIVGRPGGLDAEELHSGLQGLLGSGAVGLGIEDHLRVIPTLYPAVVDAVEL